MSKYVIEFDKEQLLEYDKDTNTYFRTLYKAKGFNALVFDKNGLDKLTPLDKELEEAYQKGVHDGSLDVKERVEGAYQKGYEVGQHEATTLEYQQGLEEGKKQAKVQAYLDVCHDIERVAHGNYQKGLDDAWECAKKISLMSPDEIEKVFPGAAKYNRYNLGYSGVEAIEKLKAYEEQQKQNKRIMFGDGLVTKTGGINGIALSNEVNRCVYVWREDCVAYEASVDEWKKTGKTYYQLAELLKAMKEGAE